MNERTFCVYKHTCPLCTNTNGIYIGITCFDPKERWKTDGKGYLNQRTDKNARVIHHLRDTEEQRKYNDEHYELFGFEIDESGNEIFNYGKYVVFWTKEHHNEYHRLSEENKLLISKASKEHWANSDYREKVIASSKKSWENNEARRLAVSNRFKGKNSTNLRN